MADLSPRIQANKQLDVIYARQQQQAANARKLNGDLDATRAEQARQDEQIRQNNEFSRLEQARSLAAEERARDAFNAQQSALKIEDYHKAILEAQNANEPLLRGTLVNLVA